MRNVISETPTQETLRKPVFLCGQEVVCLFFFGDVAHVLAYYSVSQSTVVVSIGG